ncbi:MAG: alpha/beta fold hydrolase [Burkholderiales bacterium]
MALARRLLLAVLALLVIVCVVIACWVGFTEHERLEREAKTPEQIAAEPGQGRGRWVQVADAQLYVQTWGDARHPTLLLTHGTGAWSGSWFALPAALAAAGWQVVAVDLPPFGLSKPQGPPRRVDYTRRAQAQRLLGPV